MSAFRAIVFAAALGGLSAGVAATAIGALSTGPLILQAETYEKAEAPAPAPSHAAGAVGTAHVHAPGTPAHDHGAAWQPQDGLERNAYTALFNVVNWFGFGLLLAGALVLFRRPASWREGLFWGLAGYGVFVVAPSLGLPPELPGIPVAPLAGRQLWWASAAGGAALGLGLLAFTRSLPLALLGLAAMLLPHVIGAPRLAEVETSVPAILSQRFAGAVMVSAFACWMVLGAVTGHLVRLFAAREGLEPGALPVPAR